MTGSRPIQAPSTHWPDSGVRRPEGRCADEFGEGRVGTIGLGSPRSASQAQLFMPSSVPARSGCNSSAAARSVRTSRSGADACVIGRHRDHYAFSSDDFRLVSRPQDAAFLVFAGSDAPRSSLDSYRSMLARRRAGPRAGDLRQPGHHHDPGRPACSAPGAIARIYRDLGGSVEYVGKPHRAIFRHALTVAETGAPQPAS